MTLPGNSLRLLGPLALFSLAAPLGAQVLEQRFDPPWPANGYMHFGTGLAVRGDYAFAIDSAHHLCVFQRGALGWSIVQIIDEGQDVYSWMLSVDGDWLAVSGTRQGFYEVKLFELDQGIWVLRQIVPAPSDAWAFGAALHLRADELVVGAPHESTAALGAGRAYVLRRDALTQVWSIVAELDRPAPLPSEGFGMSVRFSHDGDEVFVGAPGLGTFGPTPGSAHRFARTPLGWTHQVVITPPHPNGYQDFGATLGTGEDLLAIGAPGAVPGVAPLGAVHIYRREAASWNPDQVLTPPAASFGPRFGSAVAIDGDWLLLGCPNEHVNRGSTLLYRRGSGGYELASRYTWPADSAGTWLFGRRVALDAGVLVTSATLIPKDGFYEVGAVYFGNYADELRPHCWCDTSVPCSNMMATTGCRHDQGSPGAQLGGTGSTSVAADTLELRLTGLPAGAEVLVFMSTASGGPAILGDGLRCVGGAGAPLFRFSPTTANANGIARLGPGVVGLAATRFPPAGQIAPGETWHFQGWFRSPGGACGSGSNLTSALAVDFVP